MVKLEKSNRIENIENSFNAPIKDLLYQMHWVEDMRHRDMTLLLNAPRPTVTRWFDYFRVPAQSCRRFTDKNLTSWLYKTGRLKKKLRYKGPDRRTQRTKGGLNVDFFKKWSPEMAYVLGFFAADGCMFINSGGSKYISFTSTDYEILEKIKKIFKAKQKFTLKKRYNKDWKDTFTLQIGSQEIYQDLINLGFVPNKASRFKLPPVPKKYFNHFIRGYFDGDGSIIYGKFKRRNRNNRLTPYLLTCFASANLRFLSAISKHLKKNIGMHSGYLNKKSGHLSYSRLDSIKLFHYIYRGSTKSQYLERKYDKFRRALKILGPVA